MTKWDDRFDKHCDAIKDHLAHMHKHVDRMEQTLAEMQHLARDALAMVDQLIDEWGKALGKRR
jgi:hypothetical protein